MVFYSRVFFVLFIMSLVIPGSIHAQTESSERDSVFEAYHSEVWDEIEKAQYSDSLQNYYAVELFEYYKAHKGTKSSDRAFSSAFMMWGNTGNDEYVEEALSTLENDSHLWNLIIHSLGNIYNKSEEFDFETRFKKLENRITDPECLSQLYTSLLRHYDHTNKNEQVRHYAQKILEISATPWFADFAEGYLYELDSLQIGQLAPEFNAKTVAGDELSLPEFHGKFVLLEFWGSWCGPCYPEIPHLKTLYEKHDNESLIVVGIALDENEKVVEEFTEERDMKWAQILQTERWNGEIANTYNVMGVPRMFLVDPNGSIVAKDLRGEEMVSEVERMIAEYFED